MNEPKHGEAMAKYIPRVSVGDYVRSFDFYWTDLTGPKACYAEGVVREVKNEVVTFVCVKRIWEGQPEECDSVTTWTDDAMFDRIENGTFQILISAAS